MGSSWSVLGRFLLGRFWQADGRRAWYLRHHSLRLPLLLLRKDIELVLLDAIIHGDISCSGGDDLSVGKASIGVGSGCSNVTLIARGVRDVPVSHRDPTLRGMVDVALRDVYGSRWWLPRLRGTSLASG